MSSLDSFDDFVNIMTRVFAGAVVIGIVGFILYNVFVG